MEAFSILKKPFELRTASETKQLFETFMKLDFFSEILKEKGVECLFELLKYISLQSFPSNSLVFEQNCFGSKYYIILKGKVSVSTNPASFLITEKPEKTIIAEGGAFGELALITGKPRTATVKCEEDCLFGVLDKRNFQTVMNSLHLKEINEKIEFLKNIPLFTNLSTKILTSLVYSLEPKIYYKGNVLYKEMEVPIGIFVVKSGDFLIKNCQKNINVGVISANDVIGFEEIVLNTYRKYTVICFSAKSEISFIKKKDFIRFLDPHSQFFKEIKEFSADRMKFREESLKNAIAIFEKRKQEFLEITFKSNSKKKESDLSIKNPFFHQKITKKNGFIETVKNNERISNKKRSFSRKEDIPYEIEYIVNAKEKIFNTILKNNFLDSSDFTKELILYKLPIPGLKGRESFKKSKENKKNNLTKSYFL